MMPTSNQRTSLYLHRSVPLNNVDAVKYYLNCCGARMSDAEGRNALSAAMRLRNREIANMLLAHCHLNIMLEPATRLSFCHVASMLDNWNAVDLFLRNGAAVNHTVGRINRALRDQENWHGWPVRAEAYFDDKPTMHHVPANDKWAHYTSLHFATENRAKRVMELLINRRANVNAKDARGNTPLHLACALEEPADDVVQILLMAGANPHVQNMKGAMPAHVAVDRGNLAVLKSLVEYGANLDRSMWGVLNFSCLHLAVKNADVMQFVVKEKVNINAADWSGGTALHALVDVLPDSGVDHKKVLNILDKAGVNLNQQDHLGMTALHRAVSQHHTIMTRLLLEQGASMTAQDHFGRSPILYVLQSHCYAMRQVVYEYMEKMRLVCPCTNSHYYEEMTCHQAAPERDDLIARCKAELAKMREHRIDDRTTLYDIVSHKTWTFASHHANNQELRDFINNERCDEEYPLYAYLIRMRFRYNRRRFQLMERTKEPFDSLLNVQLPCEVTEVLFKMLSSKDLENIIEARRQQVVEVCERNFYEETEETD